MKLLVLWFVLLVSVSSGAMDDAQLANMDEYGQVEQMADVGEAATDAAGFPSPFAPPMPPAGGYESVNTEGYWRQFNRFGLTPMDCGGDSESGFEQSYTGTATALIDDPNTATDEAEGGVPTDLGECIRLCNECNGCVGFVDAIRRNMCMFGSALEMNEITMMSAFEDVRKYYNMVKTYSVCSPGQSAIAESTLCEDCTPGYFSTKGIPCTDCGVGQYSDTDAMSQCADCSAGRIPTASKDSCEDCSEAGTYSPGGVDSCINCPYGHWSNSPPEDECKACLAGNFAGEMAIRCESCVSGQYSAAAAAQCTWCAAGTYADPNDFPNGGPSVCTSCPSGYKAYTPNPHDACKLCVAGQVSLQDAVACDNCAVGLYQQNDAQASCDECPTGYFQDAAGSTHCPNCPSGHFASAPSAAKTMNSCQDCGAGYYMPQANNQANEGACKQCPLGQAAGSSAAPSCKTCEGGEIAAAVALASCTSCSLGQYQESAGTTFCKSCAAGKHGEVTGLTACADCFKGYYMTYDESMAAICDACPLGHYSSVSQASDCSTCNPGWYAAGLTNTECTVCAIGQIATNSGGDGCTECTSGHYTNGAKTLCEVCPAGYKSTDNFDSCEQCTAGYFQDLTTQDNCKTCSAGKIAAGATAQVCTDCAAGQYSSAAAAVCIQCASGKTSADPFASCLDCAAGTIANAGDAACADCAIGQFQPLAEESACDPCVGGQYAEAEGTPTCSACPSGYISDDNAGVCTSCAAGRIASGGAGSITCAQCPGSTYSGYELHLAAAGACSGMFDSMTAVKEGDITSDHIVGDPLESAEYPCPAQVGNLVVWNDNTDPANVVVYVAEEATGASVCLACPDGDVAEAESSTCITCGGGSKASADGTKCEPCEEGKGSTRGQTICTDCDAGQFSPINVGQCSQCDPGSISSEMAGVCTNCTEGFKSSADQTQCEQCQDGFFTEYIRGATCETCPAGFDSAWPIQSTFCNPCARGKYKGDGGAGRCDACPVGKYEDQIASVICDNCGPGQIAQGTEQSVCSNCTIGKYQDEYGTTECKTCAAGQSSITTFGGPTGCYSCPEGETTSPSLNALSCYKCAAGKMLSGVLCVACPSGQFNGVAGMTVCTDCAAGKFAPKTDGSFTSCEKCPKGTEEISNVCANCAAGKYANYPRTGCLSCPTGTYGAVEEATVDVTESNYGSVSGICTDCMAGLYSDYGATVCINCGAGQYTDEDVQQACKNCVLGQYQLNEGRTVCEQCSAGDIADSVGLAQCNDCASGKFQAPGHRECDNCSPGWTQPDAGQTVCNECAAGQMSNTGGDACVECTPGKFSSGAGSSACMDCPTGTTSAYGADACVAKPLGCYDVSALQGYVSKGRQTQYSSINSLCSHNEYALLTCPHSGEFELWCGNIVPDNTNGMQAAKPMADCAGDFAGNAPADTSVNGCVGPVTVDNKLSGGYNRATLYPISDVLVMGTRGSNVCDPGYQSIDTAEECQKAALSLGKIWKHATSSEGATVDNLLPGCTTGPSLFLEGGDYFTGATPDHHVYWNTGGVADQASGDGFQICKKPNKLKHDNTLQTVDFELSSGETSPITLAKAQLGGLEWHTSSGASIASEPLISYASTDVAVTTDPGTATTSSAEIRKLTTTANDHLLTTEFNYGSVDGYDGNTGTGVVKSSAFTLGLGPITFEAAGSGGYFTVCRADQPSNCLTKIYPNSVHNTSDVYTCSDVETWTQYPAANQDQDTGTVPAAGFGTTTGGDQCNNHGWSRKGDAFASGLNAPCTNAEFDGGGEQDLNNGQQYDCVSMGSWTSYTASDTPPGGEGFSRRGDGLSDGTLPYKYVRGAATTCGSEGFWDSYADECPAAYPNQMLGNTACCANAVVTETVWTAYSSNSGKGYCDPTARLDLAGDTTAVSSKKCKELCESLGGCQYAAFDEKPECWEKMATDAQDADCVGSDCTAATTSIPDIHECQAKCFEDVDCNFFEYDATNSLCTLKTAKGTIDTASSSTRNYVAPKICPTFVYGLDLGAYGGSVTCTGAGCGVAAAGQLPLVQDSTLAWTKAIDTADDFEIVSEFRLGTVDGATHVSFDIYLGSSSEVKHVMLDYTSGTPSTVLSTTPTAPADEWGTSAVATDNTGIVIPKSNLASDEYQTLKLVRSSGSLDIYLNGATLTGMTGLGANWAIQKVGWSVPATLGGSLDVRSLYLVGDTNPNTLGHCMLTNTCSSFTNAVPNTLPQDQYEFDNHPSEVKTWSGLSTVEACDPVAATTDFREVGTGACYTEGNDEVFGYTKTAYQNLQTGCEADCLAWDSCIGYSYGENGASPVTPNSPMGWPKCVLYHNDPVDDAAPVEPTATALHTFTQDMAGTLIATETYSGATDAEKDADCHAKCVANTECEFWVRGVGSTDCWLKKGFSGDNKKYEETVSGQYCAASSDAVDETDCRNAATSMGKQWGGTVDTAGAHAACHEANDGKVYWQTSGSAAAAAFTWSSALSGQWWESRNAHIFEKGAGDSAADTLAACQLQCETHLVKNGQTRDCIGISIATGDYTNGDNSIACWGWATGAPTATPQTQKQLNDWQNYNSGAATTYDTATHYTITRVGDQTASWEYNGVSTDCTTQCGNQNKFCEETMLNPASDADLATILTGMGKSLTVSPLLDVPYHLEEGVCGSASTYTTCRYGSSVSEGDCEVAANFVTRQAGRDIPNAPVYDKTADTQCGFGTGCADGAQADLSSTDPAYNTASDYCTLTGDVAECTLSNNHIVRASVKGSESNADHYPSRLFGGTTDKWTDKLDQVHYVEYEFPSMEMINGIKVKQTNDYFVTEPTIQYWDASGAWANVNMVYGEDGVTGTGPACSATTYSEASADTNSCGADTVITDAAGCQAAATALGYTWKSSLSESTKPRGCFTGTDDSDGVASAWLNTHGSGAAHTDYSPLCSATTPVSTSSTDTSGCKSECDAVSTCNSFTYWGNGTDHQCSLFESAATASGATDETGGVKFQVSSTAESILSFDSVFSTKLKITFPADRDDGEIMLDELTILGPDPAGTDGESTYAISGSAVMTGATSVDDCKTACDGDASCTQFNFDTSTDTCYFRAGAAACRAVTSARAGMDCYSKSTTSTTGNLRSAAYPTTEVPIGCVVKQGDDWSPHFSSAGGSAYSECDANDSPTYALVCTGAMPVAREITQSGPINDHEIGSPFYSELTGGSAAKTYGGLCTGQDGFGLQADTSTPVADGTDMGTVIDDYECAKHCDDTTDCVWWMRDTTSNQCTIHMAVPPGGFEYSAGSFGSTTARSGYPCPTGGFGVWKSFINTTHSSNGCGGNGGTDEMRICPCKAEADTKVSLCTELPEVGGLRGGFVDRPWESNEAATSCGERNDKPCKIRSVWMNGDAKCFAKFAMEWCDGSTDPGLAKTSTCGVPGSVPTTCDYAVCPAGSVASTASTCQGDNCVFPSSTSGEDLPVDCPCVSENLAACSYACCPSGTYKTTESIVALAGSGLCDSGGCDFPVSGDRTSWPQNCPCASRSLFYNMQHFEIEADVLSNWAGFDVFFKIEDDSSGPDGFLAIDNIKYHGTPKGCVDLTTDGGGATLWTAYTEGFSTFPAAGFGNGNGWSRSSNNGNDGAVTAPYAYGSSTGVACASENFFTVGTNADCEYATCPTGAITTNDATCKPSGGTCHFPTSSNVGNWPSHCPCVSTGEMTYHQEKGFANAGESVCKTGSSVSQADCLAAAQYVTQLAGEATVNTNALDTADHGVGKPKGCSVDAGAGGDWQAYFSTAAADSYSVADTDGAPQYQLVCTGAPGI